jgi:hypothetical protein
VRPLETFQTIAIAGASAVFLGSWLLVFVAQYVP